MIRPAGLAVLCLSLLIATAPANATSMLSIEIDGDELPSLAPVVELTAPGVVNISTTGTVEVPDNPLFNDPFFRKFFGLPEGPQQREAHSVGSGVIIGAREGYVITNNHVVAKADEIIVTLKDGRQFKAELVGTDPETDIAVLRIDPENLTALPLGNSGGLKVGDFVIAIGNPFGLGHTVTSGIVSALGRSGLGIEGYEDFIQTDASINPGNSGGALVNLRGELIGINTAILGPGGGNIGIGFAIPIDMAEQVMAQLITYGEVQRGQIGVNIQDLDHDLAEAFGVDIAQGAVVTQVVPGSPAASAGLLPGDVIVGVDGTSIRNAADLRNKIGLRRVGDRVDLTLVREGEEITLTAEVGSPDDPLASAPADDAAPRLAGAAFSEIPPDSPMFGKVNGVLVTEVAPESVAWRAGLRVGDVILSVNRQPVTTPAELFDVALSGDDSLLLNVRRGNGALFILIR